MKNIENFNNSYLKETSKRIDDMRDYTSQKTIQSKINKRID